MKRSSTKWIPSPPRKRAPFLRCGLLRSRAIRNQVLRSISPLIHSYDAVIAMSELYYGPRRGPQIWSEILRAATAEYDGPVVLAEDAMILALDVAGP